MQHMVLSLLFCQLRNLDPTLIRDDKYHVSDYAPFFEIDAHWEKDSSQLIPSIRTNHDVIGRRIFNTHLRFDMLPSSQSGGKFIYILRSPLDTCVSFYHHLHHQVEGGYPGDFSAFFEDWLDGKIAFGSWNEHVLSYSDAFKQSNGQASSVVKLQDGREFLLLTYEEMVSNVSAVVDRLVFFLQLETVTAAQRKALLVKFSFRNMKAEQHRFQPKSVQWRNNFEFLRKGQAGDSKTLVTLAQREAYELWLQKMQFRQALAHLLQTTNPTAFQKITALL